MDADWTLGLDEQLVPQLNAVKDNRHELCPLELAATWINPYHGFILLSTEEDHVMVRRDHHLSRLFGVVEDDAIAGTARRRLVFFVANVARSYPELAKSPRDTPGEQFVEEEPDVGSPRRGATSYWANTLEASS
jgi:hypothetical protein